jgi:hypothetical protein
MVILSVFVYLLDKKGKQQSLDDQTETAAALWEEATLHTSIHE